MMRTYYYLLIGKFRWLLCSLVMFCVGVMGEKSVEIINIDDDQKDAYHLHSNTGGEIHLYCSESIYLIKHTAWWVPNQKYVNYKVYGTCVGDISPKLKELIQAGFSIGPMLPAIMPSTDQKRTVLHAYATLLVHRLENNR